MIPVRSLVLWLLVFGCFDGESALAGGVVRIATSSKIRAIDPADINDVYSGIEVGTVYEGLLQFDERDVSGKKLVPNLAESMPAVSRNRLEIRVRIRKGVFFHDDLCFPGGKGRELVAQDFVDSWQRMMVPGKPVASSWIFDKSVKSVRAESSHVLKIELTSPQPNFFFTLTRSESFVVPKEAVVLYGADLGRNPVGTGPFILDRKQSNFNSRLIYRRNPHYWNPSLPRADELSVEVVSESRVRKLKVLAGELDLAFISNEEVSGPASRGELEKKGIVLHQWPGANFRRLSFNMRDPVLGASAPQGKALRQALSLAVNSTEYIEKFLNRYGVEAQGPLPPGTFGYSARLRNPYRSNDLERAKALLKSAGYPGGKGFPSLKLFLQVGTVPRQEGDWLRMQWERIGVQVDLTIYSWAELRRKIGQLEGQMWLGTWSGELPDAEDYLKVYWSGNAPPGGPNDTSFSSPVFDRWFLKMKSDVGAARLNAIQNAVSVLVEEAPAIWLAHESYIALRNRRLTGFVESVFEPTERKRFAVEGR